MITVKHGDTYEVVYEVNMDLTGASARILATPLGDDDAIVLANVIADPAGGVLLHKLTGDLAVGDYLVEVEVTVDDGTVVTFPTRQEGTLPQYERLRVVHDLG